jgi:hypothetical protein
VVGGGSLILVRISIKGSRPKMPQWEYRTIHLNATDEIDLLNDAGEEGWELVAIAANNVLYLKRQIAQPVAVSARPSRRKAEKSDAK